MNITYQVTREKYNGPIYIIQYFNINLINFYRIGEIIMSHFYGEMTGRTQTVTRCGTKNSGIEAHIRGWNFGVRARVYQHDGHDMVDIYLTSGSTGNESHHILTACRGQFESLLNSKLSLSFVAGDMSDTCEVCGCTEFLCGHNKRD